MRGEIFDHCRPTKMTSQKHAPPSREQPEGHQRGAEKLLPLRQPEPLRQGPPKPPWLRLKLGLGGVQRVKEILRRSQLATVCEEAACPNLGECFNQGTATFMILGDLCTRRCPFCDVAHGKPLPPDPAEPQRLAAAVRELGLRYVVITSVDRDDLRDGGAGHFAACIRALRATDPALCIEVLTPDFRGRLSPALDAFAGALPDVFNHNLETVPRLYPRVRPGADYQASLGLLAEFRARYPGIPTKSGLMLGLGETPEEVAETLRDLRTQGCDLLTLGQYLQPSQAHLPVERYLPPEEFTTLSQLANDLGFTGVASGPLVRSSYQADRQAKGALPRRP
jgi:lipoyl synthase